MGWFRAKQDSGIAFGCVGVGNVGAGMEPFMLERGGVVLVALICVT
jgi:hypothetical protein